MVCPTAAAGHFASTSRSVDAGAHFTTIGPDPNSGTSTPNGYPNGSSLQAASPAAAVAASSTADGPVGGLIRTTDSGATWEIAQAALGKSGTWAVLGFTTPQNGYALWRQPGGGATYHGDTAQLWHTTNGDANWTAIDDLTPESTFSHR